MKGIVWALALLGAIATLTVVSLRHRQGVVLVSPPPAVVATAEARCPDFTLEDNGVCLPLTRPPGATRTLPTVDWVGADGLVSAFFVPWSDAPVPPSLRSVNSPAGRALLIRTRVGSEVRCGASFASPVITRANQSEDGTWLVTVAESNDATRKVDITGLTALAPEMRAGSDCPKGAPLGTSGDALVAWGALD